jgi:hypothetical protein
MKTPSYMQVLANSRTYRFRVKTNGAGREYLLITEFSTDGSSTETHRIAIFEPHIIAFHTTYLRAAKRLEPKLRAYDVAKIREDYPNAFTKWTPQEDQQLIASFNKRMQIIDLAKLFGRQPGGIRARLKTLGLINTARSLQSKVCK